MNKKILIACTAFLSLAISDAFAQPFTYVSGTSGPIKSDPTANEINLANIMFRPNSGGVATLDFKSTYYTEIYSNGADPSNGTVNPSLFMFNANHPNNGWAGDIWFNTWGQNRMTIEWDGTIAINKTNGNISALKFNTDTYTDISSGNNGSQIIMEAHGTGTNDGGTNFLAYNYTSGVDQNKRAFDFVTKNVTTVGSSSIDFRSHITVRKNGKVVIGDGLNYNSLSDNGKVPDGYKLFVQEGILTEKIKVATISGGNWADYVFADDYKLRDLDEVETFIKDNKHLPEIPSAKEVEKNGLDLVQMDAKLLQKVEELTLYVIEQNKRIDAQQKEIQALKKNKN